MRYALVVFVLLAASKILIAIMVFMFLSHLVTGQSELPNGIRLTLITLAAVLLLIPVSLRYQEIIHPSISLVFKTKVDEGVRFNGLNLCMLQLRFGVEILKEQNAWFTGVGLANEQPFLDAKYDSYQMYSGDQSLENRGYKQYNFHNQYMETLVASGILGLILLLFITFFKTFTVGIHNLFNSFASLMLITAIFMLTESVLERQQGIVFFSFIFAIAMHESKVIHHE